MYRGVAQLGRALRSGRRGHRFKSCRPDQDEGSITLFTRFNPAAKRVLRAAEQACRNHNHYYVGVGHLLLALLEERDAAIEALLASGGNRPSVIIDDIRQAIGTGEDRLWDGILITPRVTRVIEAAAAQVPPPLPLEPVHLFCAIEAQGGLFAELLDRYVGNNRASGW